MMIMINILLQKIIVIITTTILFIRIITTTKYCIAFSITTTSTTSSTYRIQQQANPIIIIPNNSIIRQSSPYNSYYQSKKQYWKNNNRIVSSTSYLQMIQQQQRSSRNRGLEINREGATPQPGGMELYIKAGPDQISVGDCPFAHYVRMVLEEKNLEYTVRPCIQETKPRWLIEHYDGKMPALRHRKECYTESDVIVSYLEFFFSDPTLTCTNKDIVKQAEDAIDGIFPTIAKYIKHTPDCDDDDTILFENVQLALQKLNDHFIKNVIPTIQQQQHGEEGAGSAENNNNNDNQVYYLTGSNITLLDCSLAPKLYHMITACTEFKKEHGWDTSNNNNGIIPTAVQTYMNHMFQRTSFQKTVYPSDVVIWGWTNARSPK